MGASATPSLDPQLRSTISRLYPQQEQALRWALSRPERYLLVNAPTGSGKTPLGMAYASARPGNSTYLTQSIRLQEQAVGLFPGLALMKGRRHHQCWIQDSNAEEAPCAAGEWCPHIGKGEDAAEMCDYYDNISTAYAAQYRVTNYAAYLTHPPLRASTDLLVCDEAHRIEQIVRDHASVYLPYSMAKKAGIPAPHSDDIRPYTGWARRHQWKLYKELVGVEWRPLREAIQTLISIPASNGDWYIEHNVKYAKLRPVWGKGLALPLMLEDTPTLFMSATLMWPEWVASTLGLPAGSWAYLDLPSVFPLERRPIYYSPVCSMNSSSVREDSSVARQSMQAAIDGIIGHYFTNGQYAGLVHTISHEYTSKVLTESRWCDIMTTDPKVHADQVLAGRPSVLVGPNLTEGWDGIDNLCRFIIMPKIPFPDLGDTVVKLRMQQDSRSYDYAALVAVVQAVGRGMRHEQDYCDAWILDSNWERLYQKRRGWLPKSFTDAYKHNIKLVSKQI